MLSSSSLCKNKEVLTEMVGENGTVIVVVSAVCRSWTWHLSTFVSGWGHLISFSLTSVGLGNSFWPLIFSLPRHHDLWSVDVRYCQVHCRAVHMFKRSWPLQISTFLWFSYDLDSQKHYVPLSRVDDVGNIMAHLRSRSLPVEFNSLSRKLV